MKNAKTILLLYFTMTALVSTSLLAQNELGNDKLEKSTAFLRQDRTIMYDNDTDMSVFILHIEENLQSVHIRVDANLESGMIVADIFDSNDNKMGGITAGPVSGNLSEIVRSNYFKEITKPKSGKWTVKVNAENATGKLTINLFGSYDAI